MTSRLMLAAGLIAAATISSAQTTKLPTLTPAMRTLATLTDTVPADEVAISPNGRFALYYSAIGDIRLHDLEKKTARVVVPGGVWPWNLAWSPRGNQIVYARSAETGSDFHLYALDVDAKTGETRGVPRRITVESGDTPGISPDGRWIAYSTAERAGVSDLMVAPTSGGLAKKLASGLMSGWPRWTPDGKSIYYVVAKTPRSSSAPHRYVVRRVSVDGGSSEQVMEAEGAVPGLSPDGRFMVLRSRAHRDSVLRAIVTDAHGRGLGEIVLPPATHDLSWLDGYRLGGVNSYWPRSLHRVDLRTGATATLVRANDETISVPIWNEDGSRFLTWDQIGGTGQLMIRDQSARLIQRVPVVENMTATEKRFSPDGRYIAYRRANFDALAIYDMETNTHRTLATAPSRLFQFLWRPDSKSLLYNQIDGPTSENSSTYAIHEVGIDGRNRLVHRVSDEMRRRIGTGGMELTQTAAVAVTGQGLWLMPYDGSTPSQLLATEGVGRGLITSDATRIVVPTGPDSRARTTLHVVSLDGSASKQVKVPFNIVVESGTFPRLHADGKHVVVKGQPDRSPDAHIYMVPIDGGEPRRVATLPGGGAGSFAISPDGNTLLFTTEGRSRATFFELDLTSALKPFLSGKL